MDAILLKLEPGRDRFITEKYAQEIAATLDQWSAAMRQSPVGISAVSKALSSQFAGASLRPVSHRDLRTSRTIQVRRNKFSNEAVLNSEDFLKEWRSIFGTFSKIDIAEFQVTSIDMIGGSPSTISGTRLETGIRYEIVGSAPGSQRQQRIGIWSMTWEPSADGQFQLSSMRAIEETQGTSNSPIYVDITAAALGGNASYAAQMLHGNDYWRTILDGACGIDVYGHNGVSVADIHGDGRDDLYICQPAGLPNRLYRNRGDGTFEDVTESSGLGILENTTCALFADFDNDGRQDVILVRSNGPVLFVNAGEGKFRAQPEAFHFAKAPEGTFTGAAVADYDRDGWLDIYFCLYSYYQGTGQYRYPSPYHDAENGPPNFLMRNNRDGTFRDVTAESGLTVNNSRYSFCCAWNDYNNDGWPDLYVVNDFGRKNLYRNNGDGTFTDAAPASGAEDVGAGMSLSWLDYDADGADDVYVANMWAAAGLRVSAQDAFKTGSSPAIRALYQKHAMGNSLLRNQAANFEDTTKASGVGLGRWAWSSDTFDFDHDGLPDLYVTNGMVSGPSRLDLNSYFWRQVVANSPDNASASHDYEQGWNAINELIRSDATWSGYERNILYANNGDGTFSDISALAGLDFMEDGRSFALADFDNDGRLEIIVKNRNAPQLRLLKNAMADLPPSIAFRLQGTQSNRDAVGATVTIHAGSRAQRRTIQVGSGFLSQHSKDVFFGLGEIKDAVLASIRWPSGLVQELRDIPIDHRIWVEEGKNPTRMEPLRRMSGAALSKVESSGESLPTDVGTWLLAPVPAPDFSLPDLSGKVRKLSSLRGSAVLLHFWTPKSAMCVSQLKDFAKSYSRWAELGLHLLTINVDQWVSDMPSGENAAKLGLTSLAKAGRFSFPILPASEDVAAIYNIVYRQVFDRHRDLALPTSLLIDAEGNIVKIYQGTLALDGIEHDFKSIPHSDPERLACGLPFPSAVHTLAVGRNHLSWGAIFFQRGYLDQAEASFQQALSEDPASAEALYGIGSVYLNQHKTAAAREMFERCLKQQPNYPGTLPDAWNNLGVLATRDGHVPESVAYFGRALDLNPNHLLALTNLGNAYRTMKKWSDAKDVLIRALAVAPEDPEANYSLGMVYAQSEDNAKAYDHLQRALRARPDYPEALNNLGVLYLMTGRRDDAVIKFEQCIRVAPEFDQAYLNLARVYALEHTPEKARVVLNNLLKHHPDHPQAKQMLGQLQP